MLIVVAAPSFANPMQGAMGERYNPESSVRSSSRRALNGKQGPANAGNLCCPRNGKQVRVRHDEPFEVLSHCGSCRGKASHQDLSARIPAQDRSEAGAGGRRMLARLDGVARILSSSLLFHVMSAGRRTREC